MIRSNDVKDSKQQLTKLQLLGQGKFSVCHLARVSKSFTSLNCKESREIMARFVQNTESYEYFCLKIVKDSDNAKQKLLMEHELLQCLHYHYSTLRESSDVKCIPKYGPFLIRSYGFMESVMGLVVSLGIRGTVAQHLHHSSFSIPQIRIYCSEIVSALQTMHGYPAGSIVHRDIKASNLLLDERGHILVSDFGSAKLIPRTTAQSHYSFNDVNNDHISNTINHHVSGRTYTMPVGTEHALAPEMMALLCSSPLLSGSSDNQSHDDAIIESSLASNSSINNSSYNQYDFEAYEGYDASVDYWALGIVLYEMLTGGHWPNFTDRDALSQQRCQAARYCLNHAATAINHGVTAAHHNNSGKDKNNGSRIAEESETYRTYWEYAAIDDFFTVYYPATMFASSVQPSLSSLSFEKLAKLIHTDEERLLKAAYSFLLDLLAISPEVRKEKFHKNTNDGSHDGSEIHPWLIPQLLITYQNCHNGDNNCSNSYDYTQIVEVDPRIGCFEWVQQLNTQRNQPEQKNECKDLSEAKQSEGKKEVKQDIIAQENPFADF